MHGLRIRLSTEADSLPDSEDYVGVKSARVIPGPSLPLARSLPCIIQFLHHPTIHKLVHSHILGPKPPQLYTASKKSKARYAGPRENVGPHLLEFARCSLSYKSSSCGAFPQIGGSKISLQLLCRNATPAAKNATAVTTLRFSGLLSSFRIWRTGLRCGTGRPARMAPLGGMFYSSAPLVKWSSERV